MTRTRSWFQGAGTWIEVDETEHGLVARSSGSLVGPWMAGWLLLGATLGVALAQVLPLAGVLAAALTVVPALFIRGETQIHVDSTGITFQRAMFGYIWGQRRIPWSLVERVGALQPQLQPDDTDRVQHLWIRPVRAPMSGQPEALRFGEGCGFDKLKALADRLEGMRLEASETRATPE